MTVFNYKYLTKENLQGLNKYKYSAIDTSPLSQYVMHPTWNAIVKIIPKFIAPNVITFAGFLCMLLATILVTVYDYELYATGGRPGVESYPCEIPNWLFVTCGVLVFLAYNLDGLDGKQARRLDVSGPLGELFDHGLDSYIVFLIPFTLISVFGRDPEFSVPVYRGFLLIVSVVLNFYASHWEKYNTGTLYLPWGYDVSMWVSSALFVVEGAYGPGLFKGYMFGGYTFVDVLGTVVHLVGLLTTLPVVVYNIYLSYKNKTGKKYSFLGMLKPLSSVLLMTGAFLFWGAYSKNNIIEQHPRAFIFLFGTLFSNIASRLIVAIMCHNRCELINGLAWPLLAGIITSLNFPHLEAIVLHVLLAITVLAHVHYGVCVVQQICGHFKIKCFSVPKHKRK